MSASCKPAIAWDGKDSVIRVGSGWLSITDKQYGYPPLRLNAAELAAFPALLQELFTAYGESEATELTGHLDGKKIQFCWQYGLSSRRGRQPAISISRGSDWTDCDLSHLYELLLWLAFIEWGHDAAEIPLEIEAGTSGATVRIRQNDGGWYSLELDSSLRAVLQKLLIQVAATPYDRATRKMSDAVKLKTNGGNVIFRQVAANEISLMLMPRLAHTGSSGRAELISHRLPRRALAELAVIISGQRLARIPA